MNTLWMLTNEIMCEKINLGKERVIYVAPGLWMDIANSLVSFAQSNSLEQLAVILDNSPHICRLGYGEIKAVELLLENNIEVRKCNGLRAGILIVDEDAWFFAPTPLLVEESPNLNTGFAPNAVAIDVEQANKLVSSLSPKISINHLLSNANETKKHSLTLVPVPEITYKEFTQEDLQIAKDNLAICPPQKFDMTRQVQVYHSYVQFVELKLTGTTLSRHTITIPPELLNANRSKEFQERLRSTYRLIDEKSNISGKEINEGVAEIRKLYLRSLGPRFGTVILRQKKDEFQEKVELIRAKLEVFKKRVQTDIEKEFKSCKTELKKILAPVIKENPPDELRLGITTKKPTKEQIESYLETKLKPVIPEADSFITDMYLQCDFKDVTYESLNDDEFISSLQKAYPYMDWSNLPYDQYKAIPESD
ncbi:MAG: hypothetical protein PHU36_04475 [Syntrophomonadaceae bacterium]|nr:hypothetical protein [Syntrophomonadaceae bacterium]